MTPSHSPHDEPGACDRVAPRRPCPRADRTVAPHGEAGAGERRGDVREGRHQMRAAEQVDQDRRGRAADAEHHDDAAQRIEIARQAAADGDAGTEGEEEPTEQEANGDRQPRQRGAEHRRATPAPRPAPQKNPPPPKKKNKVMAPPPAYPTKAPACRKTRSRCAIWHRPPRACPRSRQHARRLEAQADPADRPHLQLHLGLRRAAARCATTGSTATASRT